MLWDVPRRYIAIALLLLSAGCPDDKSESAIEEEKDGKKIPVGEVIVVTGDTLLLGGKPAGNASSILATGTPLKVDPLYEQLKEKRTRWREKHPGKVFPGRAVMRVAPKTEMLLFKSAFQTAAYAGYPNFALETKDGFVDVDAVSHRPPDYDAEQAPPHKTLHVQLEQGGATWFVFTGTPSRPMSQYRMDALRAAAEFGMIGLLNSGAGGDPDAPNDPWGRDDSLGDDPLSLRGNIDWDDVGLGELLAPIERQFSNEPRGPVPEEEERLDVEVKPGNALAGAIEKAILARLEGSAPGFGDVPGVYLHAADDLTYGELRSALDGAERARRKLSEDQKSPSFALFFQLEVIKPPPENALGGGNPKRRPPRVRMGVTSVSGRLPPEVVQRIVRQNFGRFRRCYENGLRNNPNLQGRVTVRFVINRDGRVSNVGGGGDIPDRGVVSCVTRAFSDLSFPEPESGIVTVSYPIVFAPGS